MIGISDILKRKRGKTIYKKKEKKRKERKKINGEKQDGLWF